MRVCCTVNITAMREAAKQRREARICYERAESLCHSLNRPLLLYELNEAEALVEAFEYRCWSAMIYRLRGVFLARLGDDEAQIEEAFCEATRTAKEQKSISWLKRAKATCAEYRSQKASGTGGCGFRLPIC